MTDRPAPSASGDLARTPLAHVLLFVRDRALTGSLAVVAPPEAPDVAGESILLFHQGALAQAKLPTVLDPLGFILREQGLISSEQLDESLMRLAAREGLQGEILVASGACDQATVDAALRTGLRRKVQRLFQLPEAPYAFYERYDLLPYYGGERFREDVFGVIWQAIRANPNHPAIEPMLTRVGANALRLRGNPADMKLFGFDRAEQAALDLLRVAPATLDELAGVKLDPRRLRALAYVLLISKQAELVPPGTNNIAQTSIAPRTTASRPVISPRNTPSAPDPVRPSTPFSPFGSTPPGPPSRSSIPPAVTPSTPPTRTSRFPSTVPLTPELEARLVEAENRLRAMGDETYFEMLGVPNDAPVELVRAAFLEKATVWHPDRLPMAAAGLREAYGRVFAQLNEAHQTLTDPSLAKTYTGSLKDGSGTPNVQKRIASMLEAATDVQKAEIALRRREFGEAERLARRALAVNPDDPSAMLVIAGAAMETNQGEIPPETEAMLEKVVAQAPGNDRAQALLGIASRRRGDERKAMLHFRAAVEANPRNVEAQREIRIAEMRRASVEPTRRSGNSKSPPPPDSILSKLFKR